jgi:transposase
VIPRELSLLIRHHAKEGEPISRISQRFGVSRQTVYNQLKHQGGHKGPCQPRPSKLNPHKPYLKVRLAEFDLPATTLLREIKAQGYTGSMTILKDFVRQVKGERVRAITERFETLPAQQAQVDWGECGLVWEDGQWKKLYVFVFVLGYSRMLFAKFTTSTKQPVFLAGLKEAFECLGIPRELLIDNLKQAVAHHDRNGVRFNKTFLDFCEHYGTLPVAAPPYWPRVKGKVERGVGYVKSSFLAGRAFVDVPDLNSQLGTWLDTVANIRVHGTTRELPAERYGREQAQLRAAAVIPAYDTRPIELRQVASDCHIRYQGTAYSVPPRAAYKTVTIRSCGERTGSRFEVYLGSDLLAVHQLAPKGTRMVTLPEHGKAIRQAAKGVRPKTPKRSRYQQLLPTPEPSIPSPVVEVRPLALYEQLLVVEA